MAQADGTILIDTEIGAKRVKAGSKRIETAAKNLSFLITKGRSEKPRPILKKGGR